MLKSHQSLSFSDLLYKLLSLEATPCVLLETGEFDWLSRRFLFADRQ